MNRGNRSSWHGLWVMPLDHLRWGLTESIRSPRMLANRERPEAVWCRVVDEGLESCQVRLGLAMGVATAVGSDRDVDGVLLPKLERFGSVPVAGSIRCA